MMKVCCVSWDGSLLDISFPSIECVSSIEEAQCIVLSASNWKISFTIALKNALEDFQNYDVDVINQFEHARLPIGVGFLVIHQRLATMKNDRRVDIDEIANLLYGYPELRVRYDPRVYCSADNALVDVRFLNPDQTVVEDDISSILEIASNYQESHCESGFVWWSSDSKNTRDSKYFDFRGLPARVGFESKEASAFPQYIMFDVNNVCNARCIHCPQSVGFEGQNDFKHIELEVVRAIAEQIDGRGVFVRVTADGEPMLHPSFWEMMETLRATDCRLSLTTNGSALNDKNIERLVRLNLDLIDCSLDALRRETFESIRVGLDYEKTMRGVLKLFNSIGQTNSKTKRVVSFVEQTANYQETAEFKSYWENLCDAVLVREMISNINIINNENAVDKSKITSRWACPHWFRRVVINYDSSVKGCPIDWNGKTVVGHSNVLLSNIWHSDSYHNYRMQNLNLEFEDGSACKNCSDWLGTPWNLGYEKFVRDLL